MVSVSQSRRRSQKQLRSRGREKRAKDSPIVSASLEFCGILPQSPLLRLRWGWLHLFFPFQFTWKATGFSLLKFDYGLGDGSLDKVQAFLSMSTGVGIPRTSIKVEQLQKQPIIPGRQRCDPLDKLASKPNQWALGLARDPSSMDKEESNPGRYPLLAPDLHMYIHTFCFLNITCSSGVQLCGTVLA